MSGADEPEIHEVRRLNPGVPARPGRGHAGTPGRSRPGREALYQPWPFPAPADETVRVRVSCPYCGATIGRQLGLDLGLGMLFPCTELVRSVLVDESHGTPELAVYERPRGGVRPDAQAMRLVGTFHLAGLRLDIADPAFDAQLVLAAVRLGLPVLSPEFQHLVIEASSRDARRVVPRPDRDEPAFWEPGQGPEARVPCRVRCACGAWVHISRQPPGDPVAASVPFPPFSESLSRRQRVRLGDARERAPRATPEVTSVGSMGDALHQARRRGLLRGRPLIILRVVVAADAPPEVQLVLDEAARRIAHHAQVVFEPVDDLPLNPAAPFAVMWDPQRRCSLRRGRAIVAFVHAVGAAAHASADEFEAWERDAAATILGEPSRGASGSRVRGSV